MWSDTTIRPGAEWRQEIRKALKTCKVAVLLVSPEFLDSDFIDQHELPEIYDAAERKQLKLLWVHVTPALYKETPIERYQAAYPPEPALASLTPVAQDDALRQIADTIKSAVFD